MKIIKKHLFISIFLLVKSTLVYCQSGEPDSTYHYDGTAMPTYWQTSGETRGQKVAIQPDGKAVVVGYHKNTNFDFALVRYNLNGHVDSTFGGDGLVTTDLFGDEDLAYDLVIQPDGKIVAAGYSYHPSYSHKVFSVARYNTDGTLDASFGSAGKAIASFGSGNQNAYALALQADGKIVVAGIGVFNPTPVDNYFCVARFNTNGALDYSFSGNGLWSALLAADSDCNAYDVDIDSNGKIVVSGTTISSNGALMTVVRLSSTGSYDNTFDNDGIKFTQVNGVSAVCNNLIIQNDGKLLLVGGSNNLMAVKRLNIDGSSDSTFSQDSNQLIDFGSTSNNGYAITLDNQQRIIVAGASFIGGAYNNTIARLTTDGELDVTFNGDGKVIASVNTQDDFLFGITVQNDGKIIATGYRGAVFNTSLKTIRLLSCNDTYSNQTMSECLSYFWPETNQTYTTSGVYYANYTNAEGCDSIVSLNLTIYQNPNINVTQNGITLTAVQNGATYQWLDCNNNNDPIPGATNQSFVATVNGSYRCAITLNGCTDFSTCRNITTIGFNDEKNSSSANVKLFPNPTNGIVNLQSNSLLDRLIVNDLSGRILLSKSILNDNYFEISDFENGVYLVTIINKEGEQLKFKITKN